MLFRAAVDIHAMLGLAGATIQLRRWNIIDFGEKLCGKFFELLPMEGRLVKLVDRQSLVLWRGNVGV
jgi:hypothetical protein